MNGIEKKIDKLGRVVLPSKFRKALHIDTASTVMLYLEDDCIRISAPQKQCALCQKPLEIETNISLCKDCIAKVKAINT